MTPEDTSRSQGWPLHPVLLASYSVLLPWGLNVAVVGWREGLFACIVAIAVAGVIQLLCTAIVRSRLAGAVLASLVVMITFAYGRMYAVILGTTLGGVQVGRHRFLLLVCAVLVVLVGRVLRRPRRSLTAVSDALTVAVLCLLTLATFPLVRYFVQRVASPSTAESEGQRSLARGIARPDIYYIIADGYGAASTLDALYGFSNEPFVQALRDRGFYVASESRANYVTTVLSLTSSLNMDYIPARRPWFAPTKPVSSEREQRFQSTAVVRFARRQGYEIMNINPGIGFGGTDRSVAARIMSVFEWNSLWLELIRSSILTELRTLLLPRDVRAQFLGSANALVASSGRAGPKFVFAHFLAPHPPFVFTASGAPRVPPSEYAQDRAAYIDQLRFVNVTLLAVIDSLLYRSAGDPIIVLQGDHGPASEGGSWTEPSLALMRERLPILNAYRVPRRECLFFSAVTPVNSFRIIFNCAFNANLMILPDSSFFSSPYERYYEFRNVTASVRDREHAVVAGQPATTKPAARR